MTWRLRLRYRTWKLRAPKTIAIRVAVGAVVTVAYLGDAI
jgi:hypothetical protein